MGKRSLQFTVLALLLAVVVLAPPLASAGVTVGGYIKMEVQYSDKITRVALGDTGTVFVGVPLDTDKDRDNTQTVLDARASRIRAAFDDTVAGIKLSGMIEGDFFSTDGNGLTSNSRHLRLRHAFARADHPSGFFLMAGQYWSLFSEVNIIASVPVIGITPLVDNIGPASTLLARQPQLRVGWRSSLGPGMGNLLLEADVEKSSVGFFTVDLGSTAVNETQGEGQATPLFVGKASWLHSVFIAEAAIALGNNTVVLPGGKDESQGAWGFEASAQVRITPVTLLAHYVTQKGLSRLLGQTGDFPTAGVKLADPTQFENVESQGFYVGASFALSPQTAITALYGWAKAEEDATIGFTGTQIEQHQSIHLSVIHKFWKSWQAGLEYQRFNVETFSGVEGDVNFVHGALWYFF